MALLILSSVLLTFSLLFQQTEEVNHLLQKKDHKEWLVFLAQLEEETAHCTQFYVKDNQFYYEVDGRMYIIERYQDLIRKRRTTGGHQPMLTEVKEFELQEEETNIALFIEFKNGETGYGIWTKPKI